MSESAIRLTFHVIGGIAAIDEQLTIKGDQISLRARSGEQDATLSPDELEQLGRLLQQARLPRLKISATPLHIMDAKCETLTLMSESSVPQCKVRICSGELDVPAGYREIANYLYELKQSKFTTNIQKAN